MDNMGNILKVIAGLILIVGLGAFAFRYANSGGDRAAAEGQKAWLKERFVPLMIILIILVSGFVMFVK